MRTRFIYVFAAMLGMVIVAYAIWWIPQRDSTETVRQAPPPVEEIAIPDPGLPQPAAGKELPDSDRMGEASTRQTVANRGTTLPHDVSKGDYKKQLLAEIEADPPAHRSPTDPGLDADTAYRIYLYLERCSREPRTRRQAEQELKQYAKGAETTLRMLEQTESIGMGERLQSQLEGIDDRTQRLIIGYRMCSKLPPDLDFQLEPFIWLTEAVVLGHDVAEIDYYEWALAWINSYDDYTWAPPLILKRPELVEEYKSNARLALAEAMNKGHAEAYKMMSYALLQGVIYPQDLVMSLAYMRVAERKAAQHQIKLGMYPSLLNTIEQNMTPQEIVDAEKLALELQLELTN